MATTSVASPMQLPLPSLSLQLLLGPRPEMPWSSLKKDQERLRQTTDREEYYREPLNSRTGLCELQNMARPSSRPFFPAPVPRMAICEKFVPTSTTCGAAPIPRLTESEAKWALVPPMLRSTNTPRAPSLGFQGTRLKRTMQGRLWT